MKTITIIKPYTHRELSAFYGVCEKTLYNWLSPFHDEIGEKRGHKYTVIQVEIILAKLGIPHRLNEDD
jgi:hypothetical protein